MAHNYSSEPIITLRPHSRRRYGILLIIALILLLGYLVFFPNYVLAPINSKLAVNPATKLTAKPTTIRLLAAGDFIAHDSLNSAAKLADGSYNYLPMISDFVPIFAKADIRFCNDANLNGGPAFGIIGYPKFNSPSEFTNSMAAVGCNVVNTTTNHSYDKTQAAIDASVDAWAKLPNMLAVAGENKSAAERDTVHYFTVQGVKFAFLAYTTYFNNDAPAQNNYGANYYSNDFAAAQIAIAKQAGAKFIIVSVRWGIEYASTVTPNQQSIAQFLSDHGVNLVLGHGSHVLQPVSSLTGSGGNKTIVWYSLGNFLQTQIPAETVFNGVAVMNIDPKTFAIDGQEFLPLYMHYEWTADQAKVETLATRHNIKMYLLENTTQSMIDAQQLKTTVEAQKLRLQTTLNANGLTIPLITSKQL
jgi:poly-gamma-glutamate capsule biosynthesis protein CapA/YwtB (metallophosphatase superfamily)